jgi:hypothetical protein
LLKILLTNITTLYRLKPSSWAADKYFLAIFLNFLMFLYIMCWLHSVCLRAFRKRVKHSWYHFPAVGRISLVSFAGKLNIVGWSNDEYPGISMPKSGIFIATNRRGCYADIRTAVQGRRKLLKVWGGQALRGTFRIKKGGGCGRSQKKFFGHT